MDIKEMSPEQKYRHPWELSRARCLLRELSPLIKNTAAPATVIDFGAGDLFFCDAFLRREPAFSAVAVDTGYTPELLALLKSRVREFGRIRTAVSLAECENVTAELILMLDSMEFLEDEAQKLRELAEKLEQGHYIVMCMPAFSCLFSQHDVVAKSLRRYNKKYIRDLMDRVPELEIVRQHYFYTGLFLVRLFQKLSGARFDEEHRAITGWKYPETHFITKLAAGALDLDYRANALLGRAGLDLPGLSLMAICRKK